MSQVSRPATPKLSLGKKEDLLPILNKRELPDAVKDYAQRHIPPIDSIRGFANGFTGQGELAKDLTGPRAIEELPFGENTGAMFNSRGMG